MVILLGKHILIDIFNIENYKLLEKIEDIKPLMEEIINKCNLNVVGEIKHQFYPVGATLLYLLSESHFSIHTFVEMRACSIDLYTCNLTIDFNKVINIIYEFFNGDCIILKKILDR
jgi:S-adenosylmethionine decarboxylase